MLDNDPDNVTIGGSKRVYIIFNGKRVGLIYKVNKSFNQILFQDGAKTVMAIDYIDNPQKPIYVTLYGRGKIKFPDNNMRGKLTVKALNNNFTNLLMEYLKKSELIKALPQ